jgi:hypothetical protein
VYLPAMGLKTLSDVRVLWVGEPGSDHDHLSVWLGSEGAQVRLSDWSLVEEEAERSRPHVLLLDQRGHEARAGELLGHLRKLEWGRELPIVALTEGEQSTAEHANVTVVLPAHPNDVVAAIASLTEVPKPSPANLSHEELITSLLQTRASSSDLRGVLQLLNASGPFRFTGVLRFEPDETLTSLWTYDRENPELNAFPEHTPTSASYCSRVRDALAPFELPDAANDPSVATHPARHNVLAYCGVPLLRDDGSFFGTLCQFDLSPRFFPTLTVQRLRDAAAVLRAHWPTLRDA